jgi:hypothetical protein
MRAEVGPLALTMQVREALARAVSGSGADGGDMGLGREIRR